MTRTIDETPYSLPDDVARLFAEAIGTEHVHTDQAQRDEYRDPYWFQGDRTYDSSAVLYPASTEEVQAVVRIANEHGVPLWTSSQGRNNGYGGPSPRVRGTVLVSLRRMNRVLEIDHELAYVVVEPGVTWIDLHEELRRTGNDDLMISVPDLGWGSVVGNTLDSGVTYLPYGMDYQAPCGMEVVLADGTLLRTGMGAVPDSPSWHLYKRGLGPVLDPLFVQSNYGIVTRMGYWLHRRPAAYAPLFLTVPRKEQFGQAIDILRELRLDGVVRGVPVMQNTITLASHFPEVMGQMQAADAALSDEQIQQIADETGVGRWGMRTAVWGEPAVVEAHLELIRKAWGAIEGSRIDHERTYARDEWDEITDFVGKVQAGIPNLDMLEALPDDVGHIGFSPVVPLTGGKMTEVVDLLERITVEESGLNFVVGVCVISERSAMVVSGITFDTSDEEVCATAFRTVRSMVTQAAELGYGEYRAHIDFMDLAAEQYSFGDHAYRRFTEAVKDAVDPNGILAPGRHGIWPANRRQGEDR
ncbi:4-cresol dehydrogenase [hydroxylating] flavoprotein subunit [Actinomycetales bacterium JB111]|nr:4-cresol dehydrogenase [hydroxylating] flavoprotein subunit [Actinomycetales bacterium JB111]